MDIKEALENRRSCRDFTLEPISPEIITQIINMAKFAPTARNLQPWEFVVITDKQINNSIYQLAGKNAPFLNSAPVCIAIFCKDTKYFLEDGCAATTYLLLASHSFGIGSCWVAGEKKEYAPKINEILGAPPEYKLVSLVSLGYYQNKPKQIEKRNTKDLISWQKFLCRK